MWNRPGSWYRYLDGDVQLNSKDLAARVATILTTEVASALQMDGSALELVDIEDRVARVRLTGACGSCPSSVMSLIMIIEQELRRHVPEIEYLEAVS